MMTQTSQYSAPVTQYFQLVRETTVEVTPRVQFETTLRCSSESLLVNAVVCTVPAGRRLIIEHVSCTVSLDAPTDILGRLTISDKRKGATRAVSFATESMAAGDNEYPVGLGRNRTADSRNEIAFWLARSTATTPWSAAVTVTGYLVDLQ